MRDVPGDADVAIVGGSGALGFGLALRLRAAGVRVAIGSRSQERAAEAAGRLSEVVDGPACSGLANDDAAAAARIVVLAVPFASQAATVKSLASVLVAGQIAVDTTVPLATAVGGRPTRTLSPWEGSAAQQARQLLPPEAALVAGPHTVSAASLADPDARLDEDVLLCGDDRAATAEVARLVELIPGLRAVDCGKLEIARAIEQLTPLMISINRRHKAHAGVRIVGLPRPG
ncbi:MAG TPA: NADPH-dependent F420 reductase [Conexibacter sp.]|nr:NADPH-dependent F420 reductase [Conexibacter sp.]